MADDRLLRARHAARFGRPKVRVGTPPTARIQRWAAPAPHITGGRLEGVAHVFGERADVGGHLEELRAGALTGVLGRSDTRAFWEHDRRRILGRRSAGTARVTIEARGGRLVLAYSIDLPDTTYANDLRELIRRGDLRESSFAFVPGESEWSRTPDGRRLRTHTRIRDLVDVSVVAIPAFGGTHVELHALGAASFA